MIKPDFKPKSMVILYEDSMFGTDGFLRMLDFCREQAIEVIAHIGYDRVTLTPARLRSRLAPLTGDPPDVIYMISYFEDALMLVRSIKALGIKSMLCGGGGGFTLEAFAKAATASILWCCKSSMVNMKPSGRPIRHRPNLYCPKKIEPMEGIHA
jgi:hypothetical protein